MPSVHFFFREHNDLESFLRSFPDNQSNRDRLDDFVAQELDYVDKGWAEQVSDAWEESCEMNVFLSFFTKSILAISVAMIVCGSIISIVRVCISFVAQFYRD